VTMVLSGIERRRTPRASKPRIASSRPQREASSSRWRSVVACVLNDGGSSTSVLSHLRSGVSLLVWRSRSICCVPRRWFRPAVIGPDRDPGPTPKDRMGGRPDWTAPPTLRPCGTVDRASLEGVADDRPAPVAPPDSRLERGRLHRGSGRSRAL
jgi:hypothetical protein